MPLSVEDEARRLASVVELKSYMNQVATELKQWFTNEIGTAMSELTDSTTRLIQDFVTQIEQVQTSLNTTIANLQSSEADAEARAAQALSDLQALQAEVDSTVSTMQAKSAELEADDPAPTPQDPGTTEPAPTDTTTDTTADPSAETPA